MKESIPVTLTPAQEDAFKESEALFQKHLDGMPKPEDFPDTPEDDKAFVKAVEKYNQTVFEKPEEIPGFLEGKELDMAKKRSRAKIDRQAKVAANLQEAEVGLAGAVSSIDASYFADMTEEKITRFIRHATLAQVKAVLASDHWQMDDKREMIKVRWEDELEQSHEYDRKRKDWLSKMTAIWRMIGDGNMDFFGYNNDGEVVVDKKFMRVDKETGRIYAKARDGVEYEVFNEPPFPKNLRDWLRNKMTKAEYELAASIVPREMFECTSLVQVIRWPIIFKEFRTDEAFPFPLRNGLTYTKDADFYMLLDENNPLYLPEDTTGTPEKPGARRIAFAEAVKAAAHVPEGQRNEVFIKTYEKLTPKDTVKKMRANMWASGRALGEIPRGKGRNTPLYARLLNAAMSKKMGGNDSHEIMGGDGFITNMLRDFRAEQRGEGLVSQENREAMEYIFCTIKSTDQIPQSVGLLPADDDNLAELYLELREKGLKNGYLKFPSDEARGISHAQRGRSEKPAEEDEDED